MIRPATHLAFALVTGVIALAATAPAAEAQAIKIPAGVAGSWESKAMVGAKDSVITTLVTTSTADTKGWTVQFPNRPLLQARVLAAGGDSVVIEVGPYESILRKGQQATTRTTSHYKGDVITGSFEAKYSNGDIVKGKLAGKRAKAKS